MKAIQLAFKWEKLCNVSMSCRCLIVRHNNIYTTHETMWRQSLQHQITTYRKAWRMVHIFIRIRIATQKSTHLMHIILLTKVKMNTRHLPVPLFKSQHIILAILSKYIRYLPLFSLISYYNLFVLLYVIEKISRGILANPKFDTIKLKSEWLLVVLVDILLHCTTSIVVSEGET